MVQRKVYVGSFNNNKKKELINRSIEKLKSHQGNEFYYILPNGELLRQYRNHLIDRVEHSFEINLFTFDDIVDKVLEDDFTHRIDNPTKNLILREVLSRLSMEGRLHYYNDFIHMPGFIYSVNDILGDIKRSLVYPQVYLERCPKEPFYEELGRIYCEYEKVLDELNLSDREGSYFKSANLLKTKNFLKAVKTIIIDEFYDFRPIELAILEQLIHSDRDIIINMPFLSKEKSIVLENTLKILKDLGFEIEYIEKKDLNIFENLGKYLFSDEEGLFHMDEKITLINGASPYLELRRIFEEIKRYHKEGLPLRDIGIIISNPNYMKDLHKVAAMEGIPLRISKALPLKTMPITRELLNILECRIHNYSKNCLINRIKSNYLTLFSEDNRDLNELILRKENFQDLFDLKDILYSNKKLNISLEEMDYLKEIIQSIEEEFSKIPLENRIIDYNKDIKSILDDFKLKEKILNRYREDNDEKLFLRDLRTLSKIEEVIHKMDLLIALKEEISLEDYYNLFLDYIEEEAVIEIQGNLQGVHILNPINSRGSSKEVVFITGLTQGAYPAFDTGNYFINDNNLKNLKSIGIDVKNHMERLSNEGLKFASIVASCKGKLYLSYSSGYDHANIQSIFLDELISLFKKDEGLRGKIHEIKVNLGDLVKKDPKDITNEDDLSKYILNSYARGKEMDLKVIHYHNHIFPEKLNHINNKIGSEINGFGDIYDGYRGVLEDEAIIQDILSNAPKAFSISYLESYSRCPYFFMLNNLFNIEEMNREFQEYRPMDIGVLYHDVLNRYYRIYAKDIEKAIGGSGEFIYINTIDTIKDLVYRSAEEIGLKADSKKNNLIIEIALKRLMDFIEKDTERIIKDQWIPYDFEIEFGNKKPFYIEINNSKIPMVGRIDRIDKSAYGDQYMAMDYKSSSYGLRDVDHMLFGLSLQLPVYILSQEDKEVVAGAYGIISNGKTEVNLGLLPFIKGRGKGRLSQEEWDQLMDKVKENISRTKVNIEKGNFQVKPLECSQYCIYKDICRYEERLEVE